MSIQIPCKQIHVKDDETMIPVGRVSLHDKEEALKFETHIQIQQPTMWHAYILTSLKTIAKEPNFICNMYIKLTT